LKVTTLSRRWENAKKAPHEENGGGTNKETKTTGPGRKNAKDLPTVTSRNVHSLFSKTRA